MVRLRSSPSVFARCVRAGIRCCGSCATARRRQQQFAGPRRVEPIRSPSEISPTGKCHLLTRAPHVRFLGCCLERVTIRLNLRKIARVGAGEMSDGITTGCEGDPPRCRRKLFFPECHCCFLRTDRTLNASLRSPQSDRSFGLVPGHNGKQRAFAARVAAQSDWRPRATRSISDCTIRSTKLGKFSSNHDFSMGRSVSRTTSSSVGSCFFTVCASRLIQSD